MKEHKEGANLHWVITDFPEEMISELNQQEWACTTAS